MHAVAQKTNKRKPPVITPRSLNPPNLRGSLLNIPRRLAGILHADLRRDGRGRRLLDLEPLLLLHLSVLLALALLAPLHLPAEAAEEAARGPPDLHERPADDLGDALEPQVREEADEDGPRQAEGGQDDGDAPVLAVDALDGEGAARRRT